MKWEYSPGRKRWSLNHSEEAGLVVLSHYYDNKFILVGYDSTLAFLFDCERKFVSIKVAKRYVEKRLKKFAKLLQEEIQ